MFTKTDCKVPIYDCDNCHKVLATFGVGGRCYSCFMPNIHLASLKWLTLSGIVNIKGWHDQKIKWAVYSLTLWPKPVLCHWLAKAPCILSILASKCQAQSCNPHLHYFTEVSGTASGTAPKRLGVKLRDGPVITKFCLKCCIAVTSCHSWTALYSMAFLILISFRNQKYSFL